ncbi:hypothetical protein Vadar_021126 [Vaccinium darrowii]|uniref:Uncharacterized protein n=1 Tax=Vaccinium darrowii TaxID=229202 RepID=A0ACB7ZKV4_9ERIC|nr:hypothetical protein Vadar_021126 [Vaccinium darrowii]
MAEEEVAAAASPTPLDHKQKHEDLELDAPEPPPTNANEMDLVKRDGKEEGNRAAAGGDSEESEAKRPHLEENSNGSVVTDNGFQEDKVENAELPSAENNTKSEDAQEQPAEEAADIENDRQPSSDDLLEEEIQSSLVENNLPESPQQQPSRAREHQEPLAGDPQPVDVYSEEQQPAFETQTASRIIKVPNIKVGVLIGKQGDTIRPVELIGTLESINKAERLITNLIHEADARGFPSLEARGFSKIHAAGAAEQILIQVPNEKVGLIIGKDEETIKNLQTRSGARIQLTPQHIPEGDHSKERTVHVFGDKKQTEMAREMIKEVMNQQQEFRPCGPAQPQWGNHQGGPHPSQSGGYNYQQRGSYPPPSQNSQYALPPQAYGGINHPPQQMEQRHPPSIMLQQGPGGCGHMGDVPASSHGQGPSPTPMGPPPHSQGNCNNYIQPQPAAPPYSSQAPQSNGHGHGYNKAKYENQALYHPSYGGGGSQPGPLGSGYPHPAYALQDQLYGKAPVSYPQQHNGGLPRGTQPGDNISYHMSTISVQAIQQQYPQNAAPPLLSQQTYPQNYPQQYSQNTAPPPPQSQQTYPQTYPQQYPQNAAPPPPQSQQTYPQTYPQPYGSDGYNINQQQLQPVATLSAAPVYPQQGPISGYGQQQQQQRALSGYAQEGPTGGYGSYPSGYTEQPTAQNTAAAAGYVGYQGSVVPAAAYASAPTQLLIGQTVYAQPAPTQPPTRYEPYDHSGNYGSARATYTQYNVTGQMHGTHH